MVMSGARIDKLFGCARYATRFWRAGLRHWGERRCVNAPSRLFHSLLHKGGGSFVGQLLRLRPCLVCFVRTDEITADGLSGLNEETLRLLYRLAVFHPAEAHLVAVFLSRRQRWREEIAHFASLFGLDAVYPDLGVCGNAQPDMRLVVCAHLSCRQERRQISAADTDSHTCWGRRRLGRVRDNVRRDARRQHDNGWAGVALRGRAPVGVRCTIGVGRLRLNRTGGEDGDDQRASGSNGTVHSCSPLSLLYAQSQARGASPRKQGRPFPCLRC